MEGWDQQVQLAKRFLAKRTSRPRQSGISLANPPQSREGTIIIGKPRVERVHPPLRLASVEIAEVWTITRRQLAVVE